MQALYRAIAPIPELGIEAGDYVHVVPSHEVPVRLVRHLCPDDLVVTSDPRLKLVSGGAGSMGPSPKPPTPRPRHLRLVG